jgi:rod shape-determining protein MreD
MKPFHLVVTILAFLVMQLALAQRISLGPITPDFLILGVVFLALHRGAIAGSIVGFCIGFVQDLFNPGFLGLNAMVKSILGFTIGKVGQKTFPENAPFLFVLFFAAAFGHDAVYLVFFKWPAVGGALAQMFTTSLGSAVYTAVIGVAAHRLIGLWGKKVVGSVGEKGQ